MSDRGLIKSTPCPGRIIAFGVQLSIYFFVFFVFYAYYVIDIIHNTSLLNDLNHTTNHCSSVASWRSGLVTGLVSESRGFDPHDVLLI